MQDLGSHHYILDYLADEVLNRQPEHIQAFLLQTSILDRLTGKLCDAVTGRDDGQAALDMLQRANLFVVSLDSRRRWYRYHQLFAEQLRHRLDQALPDQSPELHRRACEWYAQNGRVYEAIGHALAAKDFTRAARLVEETDLTIVMRGEVTTLLSWLDALPDELVRSRPRLSISYAWALYLVNDVDAIEPRLQDALRALGVGEDDEASHVFPDEADWPDVALAEVEGLLGEVTGLRAFVAFYRGSTRRAIKLAQQALERLPEDNLLVRGAVASILGDAYRQDGDVTAAHQSYSAAITYSQTAGNTLVTMALKDDLAEAQILQGRLQQAAKTFRQVLQWGGRRHRPLFPVVQARIGLGDVLREWNDLDSAEHHLLEGIAQCELGGYTRDLLRGHVTLARVELARGNADGMHTLIQKSKQLAEGIRAPRIIAQVAAHQARLWLSSVGDNLAAATRWAQASGLGLDDQPSYPREFEHLTLVRVFLAQDRQLSSETTPRATQGLLARLLHAAETAGRRKSVIEILALQALCWQTQDKTAQAMVTLERALALAELEGYVRLFVDEGAPMAELLRQAATRGLAPVYVAGLLESWGEMQAPAAPAAQKLLIALTGRENEVLQLLAAGLSNREIASELVVAEGTVKSHLHNIFGKLDVRSRAQAILRAKELGLI